MNSNDDRNGIKKLQNDVKVDLYADPVTDKSDSQPLGPMGAVVEATSGALAGAAVGATIGSIGGPLDALIGGALGAIVGGVSGHATAEAINPIIEDNYWRENSSYQLYYKLALKDYPDLNYERDYRQAYRIGYNDLSVYDSAMNFEYIELHLRSIWEESKGESRLSWEEAKHASRDAWNRVHFLMS